MHALFQLPNRRDLNLGTMRVLLDDRGELVAIGHVPVPLRSHVVELSFQPLDSLSIEISFEGGAVEKRVAVRKVIAKHAPE